MKQLTVEELRHYMETHNWCSVQEAKRALTKQYLYDATMRAKTVADLRTIILNLLNTLD